MYLVCLTDWSFLQTVIDWKPLTVFAEGFILDLWLGPDYTSGISKIKCNSKVKVTLSTKAQKKVKNYSKVKSNYCKKGTVFCKSIRKLVWLNTWNSWTEMFWKIVVLQLFWKQKWWRQILSRCILSSEFFEVTHNSYFSLGKNVLSCLLSYHVHCVGVPHQYQE